MDAVQFWDMLVKTFGAAGVLIGGVGLLFKWLLPRYEQRTKELIELYEARLATYEKRLAEYKAMLDQARGEIDKATQERRDITDKFLATMSTCIAESNNVLKQLVGRVEDLEQVLSANKSK